ncbi:MAG: ABC transporter permease, partial [Verrucomicrobiota bacterium]|nr:ABC transporter permease [Verrucomicrobiota bacterium]
MIQDFKFAFRQLLKAPGFTAIALVTLALAIGVNAAIFSLINGVVLKPLVLERPNEVINLFSARQGASKDYRQFSHNEYKALRESTDVFSDVAAVQFALAGIGREQEMRRSFAFLSSENFFSLMGAKPAIGRFYNAEECRPNANVPVVVASYGYWQRQGGRPDFVGSTLFVNTKPYTVIGVTPPGFSGVSVLLSPDIWLPFGVYSQINSAFSDSAALHDLAQPKNYTLNVVGRLGRGLTLATVKSSLPVLAQRVNAVQPPDSGAAREIQVMAPTRFGISTTPNDDGPIALMGVLLMAMAAAVLLIACLNLANMLLARGTARTKEVAIRL